MIKKFICKNCKKSVKTKRTNKSKNLFCCKKCSSEYRIKHKKYCPICSSIFKKPTKTCSITCGVIYRESRKNKCIKKNKVCPICNIFYSSYNKTCSKKCGEVLRMKTQKNTLIKKYGVDNISKIDSVKTKKRKWFENHCKKIGFTVFPNFTRSACKLFEDLNKNLNINIQHAENGGEFKINELGYWVDGYESSLNLVIEWYDNHHKYTYLSDEKRKNEIINYLKCNFIEIKEWENKQWYPHLEHQILLLKN